MYSLYFDGASKGNPGKAGFGCVLYNENNIEIDNFCDACYQLQTNNFAEYEGLYAGLQLAKKHGIKQLKVYGDSKLVIEQMKGNWKVRSHNLISCFEKCKNIQNEFTFLDFNHVKRHLNKRADELANTKLI